MSAVPLDTAPTAEERLASLFDRHHPRLYRLALRMVADPEDARDLVQDAFLRAARHADRLPALDHGAEAWLVRVVVNLCKDRYRQRRVRQRAAQDRDEPTFVAARAETDAVARTSVRRALARLSPRRRSVIVLCELEGLSPSEAARLLGLAPVTVRWHRAAALRQLAVALDRASNDPEDTP